MGRDCLILLFQVDELAAGGKSWVSWIVDKLVGVLHGTGGLPNQGIGDGSCLVSTLSLGRYQGWETLKNGMNVSLICAIINVGYFETLCDWVLVECA